MRAFSYLGGLGLLALSALLAWQRQTPALPNTAIVATQPVVAPGCAAAQGLARVVCLAEAFQATLSPAQLAEAQRPYSQADAARWPNFPQQFSRPQRLLLSELSAAQRQLALQALRRYVEDLNPAPCIRTPSGATAAPTTAGSNHHPLN